jgi:alpha-beta hydrolase superfamily lysophospholipase
MPRFLQRWRKWLGRLALAGLVAGFAFTWLFGTWLCAPANRPIAAPADAAIEAVSFASGSGSTLHGWLAAPATNCGAVILLHGVRSDRRQLLSRVPFLLRAGYTVLLFDFQAHGESPGQHITYGHLESRDAQAAVAFVRQRFPGRPVGVIGTSLGGAAALLAQPPLDVQALVLESVFPTIVDAVKDRIEWVWCRPARLLSPLLTCQLKLRLGISPEALRPIDRAAEIPTPKLILHGTKDPRTKFAEAEEMFSRAAEPKEFVPVEGADHEDLHLFLGARYEPLILEFLRKHLHETPAH